MMRFNTPPNWPQPPAGWVPHPGWSPDPDWGPAPEGWQFWVDDAPDRQDPMTEPLPTGGWGNEQQDAAADGAAPGRSGAGLSGAWARVKTSLRGDRADSTGEGSAVPEGRKRKTAPIVLAVAGVALFAGGVGVGTAVGSDPTSSEEYTALASAKADVDEDYAALQEDYDEMSAGLEDRRAELQEREDEVAAAEDALVEREDDVKEAEGAVKEREEAVSGAERKKAENTITEGTWTVGVDIEPGTYRSTSDVGSTCYWAILTTGTNGDDIISNDLPGGGRPSVTLSEGQDFETTRCGTWELQ
ncbi:hypothetical protein ACSNO4_02495 [Kocuria flava]|uniref:hypothetical protein n=1 Tax=Kocuria flava TaxID=446860 RepID=UPI003F1C2ACE